VIVAIPPTLGGHLHYEPLLPSARTMLTQNAQSASKNSHPRACRLLLSVNTEVSEIMRPPQHCCIVNRGTFAMVKIVTSKFGRTKNSRTHRH